MCEKEYKLKIKLSDFNTVIGSETCSFCETEFRIEKKIDGGIKTVDTKWEAVELQHEMDDSELSEAIDELMGLLHKSPDAANLLAEQDKIEGQRSKLEESYMSKLDKYEEHQHNWIEKRERTEHQAEMQGT